MIVRLPNPMSAVVWAAFLAAAAVFGTAADRAFGAAVFVLACATLFTQPSPWEARKPAALALKVFLLLEFLYVVSSLYSAAFNGTQLALRGAGYAVELLRYVLLGGFVVYLIRHFDGKVRGAVEWAATASLYAALLYPAADPRGFVSVLTLCWLLFFSRLRLRFLHAATALCVVLFGGDPWAWAAAALILAAGLSVLAHRRLIRERSRFAARWSLALFALLLAGAAAAVRFDPAAAVEFRPFSEAVARQLIRRSPVFGWGPIDETAVLGRSQYAFWALKGGILGVGAIAAGLLIAGYRLIRARREDAARRAGAWAFLGGAALMLTSGRFLESFRLFFIASFFMAAMHDDSR